MVCVGEAEGLLINVLDVSWPLAHAGALPVPLGACHGAAQGASSTSSPCPECLGGQLYGSTRLLSSPLTPARSPPGCQTPPGAGEGAGLVALQGSGPILEARGALGAWRCAPQNREEGCG